jgi:hypothetical protein
MSIFRKGWRPSRSDAAVPLLAGRVDELRSALQFQDPGLVAARSGTSYLMPGPGPGPNGLLIPFWEDICILAFPELIGYSGHNQPLSDFHLTLLLYYLLTADGTPLTGKWVSFADLPDGRMYNTAFQGYSGDEIVKAFGLDLDAFKSACLTAKGNLVDIGNASFVFQALPRVPLMLTYWLGDEDFPSSCKILFDESASHYLPIDACAILGSMLVRKLAHS